MSNMHYCMQNRQLGWSCCPAQGAQLGTQLGRWQPRGVQWGEGGKEAQEGVNVHILMADSCCCTAETNTTL